jgi:hypothetical protein
MSRNRNSDFEIITTRDGRRVRILRDGARYRVGGVQMMDSARARPRITDGAGKTGTGLHQPGFRLLSNDAAAAAKARAYAAYEQSLRDAWRGDAVGEDEVGAVCTVRNGEFPLDFGSPGHIRMYKGKPTCVPDNPRRKADAKRRRRDEDDDDDVVKRTSDVRRRRTDAAADKDYPECAGTGLDDNLEECQVCHGEGTVPADNESDEAETFENTQTHHEGLGARHTDSRSIKQMMRDHQNKMADVYDELDQELSETWRRS